MENKCRELILYTAKMKSENIVSMADVRKDYIILLHAISYIKPNTSVNLPYSF